MRNLLVPRLDLSSYFPVVVPSSNPEFIYVRFCNSYYAKAMYIYNHLNYDQYYQFLMLIYPRGFPSVVPRMTAKGVQYFNMYWLEELDLDLFPWLRVLLGTCSVPVLGQHFIDIIIRLHAEFGHWSHVPMRGVSYALSFPTRGTLCKALVYYLFLRF